MRSDAAVTSRLSLRMRALAELVSPCEVLADVGCDHGFLSIFFVQSQKAGRAVAMDVRPGPLERAREHVKSYGCENRITLRLSDGLAALQPGEADAVLIAGMGGGTILHILGEGWEKARETRELILQPQSEVSRVRKFLLERGYRIEAEDMVEEDGKFYPMMRAVPADGVKNRKERPDREESWSREELRFGKKLIEERHPVLERYLRLEERRCMGLEENLAKIPGERSAARREEISAELADVRRALRRFDRHPASDPTADLPFDPATDSAAGPAAAGGEENYES